MRILIIAPQPFYEERGTPINVKLICKVLGEAGHKIDLLVFPTGRKIELKNTRIFRLPNLLHVRHFPVGPSNLKLAYDVLLATAALCLVSTKKYGVIHGVEEGGFLAVILGKILRITSVFDLDSSIPEQLRYSGFIKRRFLLRLVERLEKWCLKKSSLVITVCEALSDKVRFISPNTKVSQIEDIPISNNTTPADERAAELIKRFNLPDSSRVIYTGNLENYQGIELLIDSWKILCDRKDNSWNYKLIMVGGHELQIDPYMKLAAEKGLSDSIYWVGQRPEEEIWEWMSLGNVLVSPRSAGDNTPLKIYSYMASGRPIVATNQKVHTQVLNDSLAFMADPEPYQFSQAIFDALNNHQLAKQKAARAKQIVEKHYSYNVFQKKLLRAYASFNSVS
jgi:glycosyltransferase involved in cell wall biosynthesis